MLHGESFDSILLAELSEKDLLKGNDQILQFGSRRRQLHDELVDEDKDEFESEIGDDEIDEEASFDVNKFELNIVLLKYTFASHFVAFKFLLF